MSVRLVSLAILSIHTMLVPVPASVPQSASDPYPLAVIQGRVVCIDGSGQEKNPFFDCSSPDCRFVLKAKDGKEYRFLSGDPEAAIFTDSRVRQRDLQITGRLHPEKTIEIIKVQSIRDGKLYDIYYFCELCNIRRYAPGLCPCCRNELEFRETPP
jgi:hypothetical protein